MRSSVSVHCIATEQIGQDRGGSPTLARPTNLALISVKDSKNIAAAFPGQRFKAADGYI